MRSELNLAEFNQILKVDWEFIQNVLIRKQRYWKVAERNRIMGNKINFKPLEVEKMFKDRNAEGKKGFSFILK